MEDKIKIYENMVNSINDDYRNGDINFDNYKKELVYYSSVLNNLRRSTTNRIEWL